MKRMIEVTRTGNAVHARHQDNHINEKKPVLSESTVGVLCECFERASFRLTTCTLCRFKLVPGLAFRFQDLKVVRLREI